MHPTLMLLATAAMSIVDSRPIWPYLSGSMVGRKKTRLEIFGEFLGENRWAPTIVRVLKDVYLNPASPAQGDMHRVQDVLHPDAWATLVRACHEVRKEHAYYNLFRDLVDDVIWVAQTAQDRKGLASNEGVQLWVTRGELRGLIHGALQRVLGVRPSGSGVPSTHGIPGHRSRL